MIPNLPPPEIDHTDHTAEQVEATQDLIERLSKVLVLVLVGFLVIAAGVGYFQFDQTRRVSHLSEQMEKTLQEVDEALSTSFPEVVRYSRDLFPAEAKDRRTITISSTPCFPERVTEAFLTVEGRYSFVGGQPDWASVASYPLPSNPVRFGGQGIPLDGNNCADFSGVDVKMPTNLIFDLASNLTETPEMIVRYKVTPLDVSGGAEQRGKVVLISTERFTVPAG